MVGLQGIDTTYAEMEDMALKQKGQINPIREIDGKLATTVSGAQRILEERAAKEGHPRSYSRDTVYRMFTEGKIGAVQTPSANFYYIEDLQKVIINPGIGRPPGSHYPQEIRDKALELRRQGMTQRAIAQKLSELYQREIRFQLVAYWLRHQ